MENVNTTKRYDLEDRTYVFAKRVRQFLQLLPKTTVNIEDGKQLLRSSGSIGANYIEANEALSKKDFIMRVKICRKEAKETRYWLNLIEAQPLVDLDKERHCLIQESGELLKIFSAIILKSE